MLRLVLSPDLTNVDQSCKSAKIDAITIKYKPFRHLNTLKQVSMNYIYLYIDKKIQELCHYFAEHYSFISTITDRNKWTRNGED